MATLNLFNVNETDNGKFHRLMAQFSAALSGSQRFARSEDTNYKSAELTGELTFILHGALFTLCHRHHGLRPLSRATPTNRLSRKYSANTHHRLPFPE
ncbi:MAG: hypothetical protein LPD71_01905 [Shewanella sp.]|nr:hypothetical protein [Shewanella sp.]MCF1430190.1 hypothetical protein [Shewanella sp.]MCF1437535.1 hypothetical protein [Shewanella sp.]MCF1459003.1 hypothetical protein [Shewanella sp.]